MEIDKRILNLSYSSLLTLHTCPRKFQLYRLNSKREDNDHDGMQSLTFDYGHFVGEGVQKVFEGESLEKIFWNAFLKWNADLLIQDTKRNKSFFGALYAIECMYRARANGYLDEYELVQYQGKPACELSFLIRLPDGFIYRGYVDAVLQHKLTGEVMVLECKTENASTVNPVKYKNSAQAIGYSIVLDSIFPDLSSYKVYYVVWPTKKEEWTTIPFEKSYYQRALWIRELLLDVEMIKLYEAAQIYPMHGESCYDFFSECEYMQHCTLSTHHLVEPLTQETSDKIDEELSKFQIQISIQDLIEAQLKKNTQSPMIETVNGDEML